MKKTCSNSLLFNFPLPFSKLGFTLIELLVAVSIITIFFSLGMAQYVKFNRQQILKQAALELKTNLIYAQNMALSGKKKCLGGFDGILAEFDGANEEYTISSSCNQGGSVVLIGSGPYELPQGVEIVGSPDDILFKTLTGGTGLASDETISLSDQHSNTANIMVSTVGKIEIDISF